MSPSASSTHLAHALCGIMCLVLFMLSACDGKTAPSSEPSTASLPEKSSDTPLAPPSGTEVPQTPPDTSPPPIPPESAPPQTPLPPPPPPVLPPPPELVGQWSAVLTSPIVQVHLNLLTSGKVLSWGGAVGEVPYTYLWDPATGTFTEKQAPSELFCAGHSFLPDGRLFVTGGHIMEAMGLPNTNVFDPVTDTWEELPVMAQGRWYPSNITLPNGDVLTVAGTDETGENVLIPEVWDGSEWRTLPRAALGLPYYPRMFVAPDGLVFYAGEEQQSLYLNVRGNGKWTYGPMRKFGVRDYGSAVMYEPGKILYAGGGDPPTSTAELIDLNELEPAWNYTGSMESARRHLNATLLPTGEVLVTGGTSASGFNDLTGAVRTAEVWNPTTGTWTTLASSTVARIYHSTALLLPDGRVLYTGSGDGGGSPNEPNYELYSPPYLFKGARPHFTGELPSSVEYGQILLVASSDDATITKVTFIALGTVTHAMDQGTRLVPLSFSVGLRGLSIALPDSRTVAPPGPYMLFLVNAAGVPSEGKIMLLQ